MFLSRKHKDGKRVKYNSGFYITTNVFPDFCNEIDNEAIRKRLVILQTKPLKKKSRTISGKLHYVFPSFARHEEHLNQMNFFLLF